MRIICDDFFELRKMPVEKYPWSLETQAHDLASCDIGLAPLPDDRFSRGKCGFKILQYAAAGLPVIASPVGCNSSYVEDGIDGLHAPNPNDWVEKISQLLNQPETRKQMGEQAKLKSAQFDKALLGQQFTELIKKCLEKR